MTYFQQLADADPANPNFSYNLGVVLNDLAQPKKAAKYLLSSYNAGGKQNQEILSTLAGE